MFTGNLNDDEDFHISRDDMPANYDEINLGETHKTHDWQSDRIELGLSPSEIKEAEGWIEQQKKSFTLLANEESVVEPETLNAKQKKAYEFITAWIDNRIKTQRMQAKYI